VIHTAQENIRMPDPTRDSTGVNSPEEAERQNRFVQETRKRRPNGCRVLRTTRRLTFSGATAG